MTEDKYVLTAVVGTNADLFPDILQLYARKGARVADVTYGKGVFWKNVDISRYDCHFSDLQTGIDARSTPYDSDSFDLVVIDPPYAYSPSRTIKSSIADGYGLNLEIDISTNAKVLELYFAMMIEAIRIVKPSGFVIVKCQDIIESSKQKWNHTSIKSFAEEKGLYSRDLFLLIQTAVPARRWKSQKHARRNHSYFWVFQKPPFRAP